MLVTTRESRKVGESVKEFCERRVEFAKDELRLFNGIKKIYPLLVELQEIDTDVLWGKVNEMSVCQFQEAAEILKEYLKLWSDCSETDILLMFISE